MFSACVLSHASLSMHGRWRGSLTRAARRPPAAGSPVTPGSSAIVRGTTLVLMSCLNYLAPHSPRRRRIYPPRRPCAHVRRCLQHLGWRFSAAEDGLEPFQFWGIRRLSFAHCGIDIDTG